MKIEKLMIAVTFFFNEGRLQYLSKIANHFPTLADEVSVSVVTNADTEEEHEKIYTALPGLRDVNIFVPRLLGHPYLLTWSHLDVFRNFYLQDKRISHFLYLEDDLEVKIDNVNYWLAAREYLRPLNLIPSFLRYEIKDGGTEFLSTDIVKRVNLANLPKIKVNANYLYINIPKLYQGTYLMDRELAAEHFFGPSSSPDFGIWAVREKAAQGLTFSNVPDGFHSRNLIGFRLSTQSIDVAALVHHTPNNYANNCSSPFGKIPVSKIVITPTSLFKKLWLLTCP
jgi:hypothetical protein